MAKRPASTVDLHFIVHDKPEAVLEEINDVREMWKAHGACSKSKSSKAMFSDVTFKVSFPTLALMERVCKLANRSLSRK